jgi:hypothetical protein
LGERDALDAFESGNAEEYGLRRFEFSRPAVLGAAEMEETEVGVCGVAYNGGKGSVCGLLGLALLAMRKMGS